jgi:GNAT superfamily N-acetyltransferase
MKELTENGARFLLIREWPEEEGQAKGNLVGFAHFRVTVTGEFMDEMTGESCLCLWDIHIEEDFQRKGLGRHIMMMLEVMARTYTIDYVVAPIMLDDEESEGWFASLKGYSVATGIMSQIGLDAEMEGFQIYHKPIQHASVKPRAAAAPLADISNKTTADDMAKAEVEKPAATVFATPDAAAEASLDEAVEKLKGLFVEKNNREPTDEEVQQWKSVLAESDEAEAGEADDKDVPSA